MRIVHIWLEICYVSQTRNPVNGNVDDDLIRVYNNNKKKIY